MKNLKHLLLAAAIALSAFTLTPRARAAEYDYIKTVWNVANFTNVTGTATNLAATIDCTTLTDFWLEFQFGLTNPAAGTFDVRWEKSGSGTFLTTNTVNNSASGWWSAPATNQGTKTVWGTNITMDAAGYYRITWGTNQIGQSCTSVVIRAYGKPKRQSL